ncbi:MAG: beta-N-acetylglucosaminidase, partial [Mucilaginibacter sp.]|nr:beta-N-acetylglucosaminidase [Mucilaginibacter sp.]
MRRNKRGCYLTVLFGLILVHSACAQPQPFTGKAYVKEQQSVEQATVLLNNEKNVIPLRNLDNNKIASIHFSTPYAIGFDSLLNKYAKVDIINGNDYMGAKPLDMLVQDTKFYQTLILQLTDAELSNPQVIEFIKNNQKIKDVVISFIGNSSSLVQLNEVTAPVIWSGRVSPVSALFNAQAIFGGVAITQRLTKNYSAKYTTNTGFLTSKVRLQYTVPEDAGIDANNLNNAIDAIARE